MNSIADINPSIAASVEQAEAIRGSMQMKLDEMRQAYHKAPYPTLDGKAPSETAQATHRRQY